MYIYIDVYVYAYLYVYVYVYVHIYEHTLWITILLIIWILSGYINLGTSITALFTACFCHHYSNDESKSLHQW